MNTMKWLVKREFWEHKGGFFWAPVVVGAIMTFFLAITLLAGVVMGTKHGFHVNGEDMHDLSGVMTAEQKAQFAHGLATGYMGVATPLIMVLGFMVFFYCLSALYDERKDRSVLFWKSLPISDQETVLSKLVMALGLAPLITLVAATITSVLSMFFICIAAAVMGVNLFVPVLSSSATYLAPFQMAATIPVYILWALPSVGWLMMVSAWSRTKPFLWAVGVPVLTGALISWFNAIFDYGWNVSWFWKHIVGRGLLSVAPGSWFGFNDSLQNSIHSEPKMSDLVAISWQSLATADLWIGAVLGAGMIYVAMRLRRYRDEG